MTTLELAVLSFVIAAVIGSVVGYAIVKVAMLPRKRRPKVRD